MKDPADTFTTELIPSPNGRGRPRGRPKTGKAMTPAERKAAQRKRDRKAVALIVEKPHQVPPRVIAKLAAQSQDYIAFAAWLELGERRGWISSAQRIALRDARLEKREAPFTCKYCGSPSWLDPVDQTPPPDYCHDSDHGNRLDGQA